MSNTKLLACMKVLCEGILKNLIEIDTLRELCIDGQ